MKCRDFRTQFGEWLNEVWEQTKDRPKIPKALLDHAASCEMCKKRLEVSMVLFADIEEPPANIVNRVMSVIPGGAVRRNIKKPSLAVGLICASLALFAFYWAQKDYALVELSITFPSATKVVVVGDWNDWDQNADLLSDPDGDGVWQITLLLRATSEARYQFVIDDTYWAPDPDAELQVEDGFGGYNSVLLL